MGDLALRLRFVLIGHKNYKHSCDVHLHTWDTNVYFDPTFSLGSSRCTTFLHFWPFLGFYILNRPFLVFL